MYEQDFEWYNFNKRKNKHFPGTVQYSEVEWWWIDTGRLHSSTVKKKKGIPILGGGKYGS